jgi:hypothetical protein
MEAGVRHSGDYLENDDASLKENCEPSGLVGGEGYEMNFALETLALG